MGDRRRNTLLAAGADEYRVPAVQYTGSQYLTAPGSSFPKISGSAAEGTFSAWFRFDGSDGATQIIAKGANFILDNMTISKTTSNKIKFSWSSSTSGSFAWESSNSYTSSSYWHHILAAWKNSTDTQQLYINNSSDINVISNTGSISTIMLDNFFVNSGPSQLLVGSVAQLWLDDSYMDISNGTNRAKFISGGKPTNLGSDGSATTGIQPMVFLSGNYNNAGLNGGTSGDFTVTGTPLNTGSPS